MASHLSPDWGNISEPLASLLKQHFESDVLWQRNIMEKLDEMKEAQEIQFKRMDPVIAAFEQSGVVRGFLIGLTKVIIAFSAAIGAFIFILEKLRTFLAPRI